MTTFDSIYIQVYNQTRERSKKRSKQIAGSYPSVLQVAVLFAVGSFFYVFLNQTNVYISSEKAWLMFVVISIFLLFKNWMKYNAKMRSTLNAKYNSKKHTKFQPWVLIGLPFVCLALGILILQAT